MKSVDSSLLSLCMIASGVLITHSVYAEIEPSPAPTVRVVKATANPQQTITVEMDKQPLANDSMYSSAERTALKPNLHINTKEVHIDDDQSIHSVRQGNDAPIEAFTVISPSTPVMPANAFKMRSEMPIQYLDVAENKMRLTGHIRGLEVDIYHFNAEQGQTLNITHDHHNTAIEVALFRPSIGMRLGTIHVLPETGDYELRIVQSRQDAAHNKTPRHYDITISLN